MSYTLSAYIYSKTVDARIEELDDKLGVVDTVRYGLTDDFDPLTSNTEQAITAAYRVIDAFTAHRAEIDERAALHNLRNVVDMSDWDSGIRLVREDALPEYVERLLDVSDTLQKRPYLVVDLAATADQLKDRAKHVMVNDVSYYYNLVEAL